MCRHEAEVERLHTENSELTNQIQEVLDCNEGLRKSSLLLQERSQALLEELSLKEAEWSQREDKLKAEVSNCLIKGKHKNNVSSSLISCTSY